jgi:hypothetical protein
MQLRGTSSSAQDALCFNIHELFSFLEYNGVKISAVGEVWSLAMHVFAWTGDAHAKPKNVKSVA